MKTKMLSTLFDMWNEKKYELIVKASVIPGFLWAQRNVLATDLEIVQNVSTTSSNFLTNFSNAYCKSIVWLAVLIELAVLVFSKDDKKIAIAQRCFFGCFVLYLFFKLIGTDGGVVGKTADTISNWMGGK